MTEMKLLFITHEMSPFLEMTDIADVVRKLTDSVQEKAQELLDKAKATQVKGQGMQGKGLEIRILMPRFGNINAHRNKLHEVIRLSGLNITIDDKDNPLIGRVASIARVQVYFLDNEDFFQRKYVFRDKDNKFYADNDERAIFFCKGALEAVKKLGWAPNIVHCHGWMSSLVPAYLKTIYKDDPTYKNTKVVYSVYQDDLAETLGSRFAEKATMNGMTPADTELYVPADITALNKGAISYADAVVYGSDKVNPDVAKFAKKTNKLLLEYPATLDFENYYNLYQDVINEELISIA